MQIEKVQYKLFIEKSVSWINTYQFYGNDVLSKGSSYMTWRKLDN